jgi:serine/threonine protein kinase
VALRIGFGQHVFRLPLKDGTNSLVKLADFGTSVIGNGGLGDPITIRQFTTLENTPPEFLLLGSHVRQSYSADTFCLGLSFLHLLTGLEPYEELLADVHCPDYLRINLSQLWSSSSDAIESHYYVISEAMRSLEGERDHRPPSPIDAGSNPSSSSSSPKTKNFLPQHQHSILYDTVYRYLVLVNLPTGGMTGSPMGQSVGWAVVAESLGISNGDSLGTLGGGGPGAGGLGVSTSSPGSDRLRAECVAQFRSDRACWSIQRGSHPIMINARNRLHTLGPEARRILLKMLHLDPSRRCTMHECLNSDLFSCLREGPSSATAYDNSYNDDYERELSGALMGESPLPIASLGAQFSSSIREISYMHYSRNSEQGGHDALSIL